MNIDLNIAPSFDSKLTKEFLDLMRPLDQKYTYNDEIKDILIKNVLDCGFEVTEQMKRNLGRYVYVARDLLRKERKEIYKNKMLDEGWLELNEDNVKSAFTNKKKLEVIANMSSDWLTTSVNKVYKPFVDKEGQCFLMNPKARTRGYYLHRFENAFCKLI